MGYILRTVNKHSAAEKAAKLENNGNKSTAIVLHEEIIADIKLAFLSSTRVVKEECFVSSVVTSIMNAFDYMSPERYSLLAGSFCMLVVPTSARWLTSTRIRSFEQSIFS